MNKLILAKIIFFFLTGLLIAGFGLLVHKIAKKNLKSNQNQELLINRVKESFLILKDGESVRQVFPCQNFLCFQIETNSQINRIEIFSPETGKKIQTIMIKTK